MTKRLTIALVALAMFVLVAILPVSATSFYVVNTSINAGASVYIGEQGLDFTNAIANFTGKGYNCKHGGGTRGDRFNISFR